MSLTEIFAEPLKTCNFDSRAAVPEDAGGDELVEHSREGGGSRGVEGGDHRIWNRRHAERTHRLANNPRAYCALARALALSHSLGLVSVAVCHGSQNRISGASRGGERHVRQEDRQVARGPACRGGGSHQERGEGWYSAGEGGGEHSLKRRARVDDVVLGLLKGFLEESCGASGSASATQVLHGKTIDASGGYILDGFPRTAKQAEMLSEFQGVNLVLNLYLREDVLIEKCLGRRICPECNGNYNVADIYRPAENGKPEIGKRDREREKERGRER